MLWKIDGSRIEPISNVAFSEQQLQERDLESWIQLNPDLLDEPLMIIGRQVNVPGINDRLDLLALDPSGNAVIIEIKRGTLSDPVDIQAMRYASYISRWSRRKLEELAEAFLSKSAGEDEESSFNEVFSEFADDTGADGIPSLNGKQRIIIVGQKVQNRLGSVALWLREQGIDIKIIEMNSYKDPNGQGLILSPQVIIPPPSTEEFEVGVSNSPTDPWITDGENWHLQHRCKSKGRQILVTLINEIKNRFPDAQGPNWNQKFYVSFRLNNSNWIAIVTRARQMNLVIRVPNGKWDSRELANRLEISVATTGVPDAEQPEANSLVRIRKFKSKVEMVLVIKHQELLECDEFWNVIDETRVDFLGGM